MLPLEATGGIVSEASPGRNDISGTDCVMPGLPQSGEGRLIGVGRDDAGAGVQIVGVDGTHHLRHSGERKR